MTKVTKEMMDQWMAEAAIRRKAEATVVSTLLAKGDFLDEDGYPTQDALTIVELWPFEDSNGWFIFIESLWYMKSFGWASEVCVPNEYRPEVQARVYHISTAGWSGNESIIRSMEKNESLWHYHWVQSRRGGHYIFEVELDDDKDTIG